MVCAMCCVVHCCVLRDSETVFGYKDLRINLYCTAARMITLVDVKYTDKLTPQRTGGVDVRSGTG